MVNVFFSRVYMENKKRLIKEKAKKIKIIITDVDGVLTDGSLFIDGDEIEPFGKFNILDGYAVVIAKECNLRIIVISGRKSLCTEARCKKLGIEEVYTGINDKAAKLTEIKEQSSLDFAEVAYIGDDLIDLRAMGLVGFKVAPKNAVKIIKRHVDYVTKAKGGKGALRELVEYILKAQKRYIEYTNQYF